MSQFSLFNTTERVLLIIHHITALSRPLRSRLLLIWYTIDGQYLDMEAWLRSWWRWALFRVKYRLKFSVRRFSLRRFSLRSLRCGAFAAEPSLRNLHCELSLRISSAEIVLLGFHREKKQEQQHGWSSLRWAGTGGTVKVKLVHGGGGGGGWWESWLTLQGRVLHVGSPASLQEPLAAWVTLQRKVLQYPLPLFRSHRWLTPSCSLHCLSSAVSHASLQM